MTLTPERLDATSEDVEGVTEAVKAYVEGFVTGDADRHERAYHHECVKRRLVRNPESGAFLRDDACP